jgi:hypothetical protein
MTEREIVENASGVAMGREGSVESPIQIDVSRKRSATSCFTVVANKLAVKVAPANDVGPRRSSHVVHRCTATHNNIDIVR